MPFRNYDAEKFTDLRQMLHASAERYGEKPFLMQMRAGGCETVSFRAFREAVEALGTALLDRGLGGKRIVLCGENHSLWACAYMAVICGVGVIVPVSHTASRVSLCEIVRKTHAAAVIGTSIPAEVGNLTEVISFDRLPHLIRHGKQLLQEGDRRYADVLLDPNACAAILFTSRHTGRRRGVMLSHRNLCCNLFEMSRMVRIREQDVFLSVLPLHHAYECTCGLLFPLSRGSTVAYAGGVRTLLYDMRRVRPTVMLCVSSMVKILFERAVADLNRRDLTGRARTGVRMTDLISSRSVRDAAKRGLFSDVRRAFGGRLRLLISGGDRADPSAMAGLRAFGIQTLGGYGMTECAPVIALNRDTCYRDSAAGMMMPGILIDIEDPRDDGVGEIRVFGENVMLGYYEDPEATAAVLRDGWFYTGELGYMDENGFLFVVGHCKNAILLENGAYVIPEEIERRLLNCVYIKEALVRGAFDESGRAEAQALIYPDYDRLAESDARRSPRDRADPEIRRALAELNSTLPPERRIGSYRLVSEPFPRTVRGGLLREK